MIFDRRKIQCHFKNFKDGKDLNTEIWLLQKPSESMCIATPWADKPQAFYHIIRKSTVCGQRMRSAG